MRSESSSWHVRGGKLGGGSSRHRAERKYKRTYKRKYKRTYKRKYKLALQVTARTYERSGREQSGDEVGCGEGSVEARSLLPELEHQSTLIL